MAENWKNFFSIKKKAKRKNQLLELMCKNESTSQLLVVY